MVQTAPALKSESAAAESRRREILAAASTVFRRRGFAATGMREIGAQLGMTAGNLYYYFRSKDDLLAYCQETTVEILLDQAERIAAGAGSAADKLRRIVIAHAVCLNETLPGSLAHLEPEALPAERRAPLARRRKRYEQLLVDLVETGQARGELRPGEARLAVLALLGALNWTVKWFSGRGEKSAAEVGERFAELFLDGLRAEAR
jgi:AcrR family transcriptional regulator